MVKHGATGVLSQYEHGTDRLAALQFLLRIKNQDVAFSLPVRWRTLQKVLELQQIRWWEEEDVYRVAWRNIRDGVLAQLTLYATEILCNRDRGHAADFSTFALDLLYLST